MGLGYCTNLDGEGGAILVVGAPQEALQLPLLQQLLQLAQDGPALLQELPLLPALRLLRPLLPCPQPQIWYTYLKNFM